MHVFCITDLTIPLYSIAGLSNHSVKQGRMSFVGKSRLTKKTSWDTCIWAFPSLASRDSSCPKRAERLVQCRSLSFSLSSVAHNEGVINHIHASILSHYCSYSHEWSKGPYDSGTPCKIKVLKNVSHIAL